MKFNVEIELGWIDEESTIDEEIKHQIVSRIEKQVAGSLKAAIMEKAEAQIQAELLATCRTDIQARINELLTKPRVITDQYGRVQREEFTLEQMLIELIDGALSRKTLDSEGKPSNYQPKYSYVDWYCGKGIEAAVSKKVGELAEQTKKHIEQLVSDKIKQQVADKLTSLIVDNSSALSLKA